MLLSTGIPKLDELLGGGIKNRSSVLIDTQPGVRCAEFAQQILARRLSEGERGLYVVNNKGLANVKKMFKNGDLNISEYESQKKVIFLDAYSAFIVNPQAKNDKNEDEGAPQGFDSMSKQIFSSLDEMSNGNILLVLDALSSLVDVYGDYAVSFFEANIKKFREYSTTVIALFVEWPYDKKLVQRIKSLFDCIIELKAVEKKVILRNYFAVSKASWTDELTKREIPFKVAVPGGIKIYVPKILVTGDYHAGKSSFVHSASTTAVSVNRLGTTVALDHGHVEHDSFSVDLFGTPGQERFDPILQMLGGESLGVVVMVDSTKPQSFARAKEMMEKSKTYNLPYVVVANKANLEGALTPEEIRGKMNLPEDIPILPVVAEDLAKVKAGEPCKLNPKDIELVLSKLLNIVV